MYSLFHIKQGELTPLPMLDAHTSAGYNVKDGADLGSDPGSDPLPPRAEHAAFLGLAPPPHAPSILLVGVT